MEEKIKDIRALLALIAIVTVAHFVLDVLLLLGGQRADIHCG